MFGYLISSTAKSGEEHLGELSKDDAERLVRVFNGIATGTQGRLIECAATDAVKALLGAVCL